MSNNINDEIKDREIDSEENEIGYTVFYADSEEAAKVLAIKHIHDNATKDQFDIVRPKIYIKQIVLGMLFPLLAAISIVMFALFREFYPWWAFVLSLVVIIFIFIERFVILLVLMYQKLAPERLRAACLFEPSCSNYMLMAIDKYGFLIGFIKGIRRVLRCHPPNGGKDYP